MKDDILIGDTPKAQLRRGRLKGARAAGRLWKHSTLADISGLVSHDWIAQAFTVTLVRNPWDRMVSLYCWLRQQEFDNYAVALAGRSDFARFLCDPQMQAAIRAHTYSHYMRDAVGAERARLFIRLEAFDQDAQPFWDHLGFRLELPVLNQSDRERGHAGYYTTQTAKLVGSLCGEDIARFGYKF